MSPDRVAAEARRWIGTPYRHQGATRGAGCDCLGLVRGIWVALYGTEAEAIPVYGADWRDGNDQLALAAGQHLRAREGAPQTGDVVLFRLIRHRPARHCGVMVSAQRFVHAQEHLGVVEMAMSESWRRRLAGAYRFP